MFIPYARQSISEDDIAAVTKVLRSDFLTQGPTVPAFERALTIYCKATHAVAMNSATSALHVACLALGVGPATLFGQARSLLSQVQIAHFTVVPKLIS